MQSRYRHRLGQWSVCQVSRLARRLAQALATTGKALAAPEIDPEAASALLQLQAQLQYRRGDAQDCIGSYDTLMKQYQVRCFACG
jgi:hypothetical protein